VRVLISLEKKKKQAPLSPPSKRKDCLLSKKERVEGGNPRAADLLRSKEKEGWWLFALREMKGEGPSCLTLLRKKKREETINHPPEDPGASPRLGKEKDNAPHVRGYAEKGRRHRVLEEKGRTESRARPASKKEGEGKARRYRRYG